MSSYREISLVEKTYAAYAEHQRRHARNKITYGRKSRRDAYGELCLKLEWLLRRLVMEAAHGNELHLWRERVLSYAELSKGWRQQRFRELDGVIGGEAPVYVLEVKASTSPAIYQAKRQASRAREIMAHRWDEVFVAGIWIDTGCLVTPREDLIEEDQEMPQAHSTRSFLDTVLGPAQGDIGLRLELEEVLACGEQAGLIESSSQLFSKAQSALAERALADARPEPAPITFEEKGFHGESPFAALLRQ